MTTPLTPPTFGDKYSVGLTDIGQGYAAGITSAGQSIAGAIGAVMGGINEKTGEAQAGILDQKKGAEDTIDMLHMHGMLTNEEYEKAKTSSLSAQQKIIGMNAADFNMKTKAELERQNALAQIAAQNQGAMSRTQYSETATTGRSQAQLEAELKKTQMELQQRSAANPVVSGYTPVPPPPVPGGPVAPAPKLSLGL
jgi:hypothetical protein